MHLDEMEFRRLDVYFVYAFALPAKQVLTNWDKLRAFDERSKQSREGFHYLPPYVQLQSDSIRIHLLGEQPQLCELGTKSMEGRLSPHSAALGVDVVLKRNGGGCCVLSLQVTPSRNPLTVASVLDFTLLGDFGVRISLKKTPPPKKLCSLTIKQGSFYDFYHAVVKDLLRALNQIAPRDDGEDPLIDVFAAQSFQHPYVVTTATLRKGLSPFDFLYDAQEQDIRKTSRALMSLLLRSYILSGEGADAIEEKYLGRSQDVVNGRIENLHPFPHIFSGIHDRSCLAIHGDYSSDFLKRCGQQYLDAVLESVITARAQWFVYLLLNAKIDDLLGQNTTEIYGRFTEGKITGRENSELEQVLRKLIRARTMAALALNDPVSYGRAAGTFTQLFTKLIEMFRIEQLEKSAQIKLQALDKMYDDLRELYRLNLVQVTEPRVAS
jgi:hypothetical protein